MTFAGMERKRGRNRPDDWQKSRSHGTHLTTEEIEWMRQQYKAGMMPKDAARALLCSTRVVNKYYAMFRGDPAPVRHKSLACKLPVDIEQPGANYQSSIARPSLAKLMAGRG